jgi:two-component system sensor histidine kinase/response regulator
MSHEIRTPMNAILGMAYLALKRQPEPQLRDYLNKIHTAGLALLGIINDILDFSKIEAGKLDIENTHFELSATLSHITNLFSQKITEKGIVLVYDLDPDIPDNLLGDPLRLNQILINLINNAIKFTENGKIRLTSRIEKQTDQHVRIRFSVQDSGIGMTPEQQKRLFQAFSQADSSTTRKYGGTGLGLTICKRLVDLMGGEISVESVAGQGSTFSFTVNLGLSQQPRKQVPTEFSRLKALVVDDGEEAREILQNGLQELSITADAAASGSEALAMLRAGSGQRSYDVVLLDWRMAGMDGLVTAQEIRQDSRIVQQPAIVIVSSYCLGTLQQEFSSLDIQGFLAKPVNPSMLFNLLAQLFAREVRESCPDSDSAIVNQSLAGAKLLLVEDNEINQQIAMELLTGAGGEVQIAANGREAVSRLVEQQETYDIVLMDLQMPEMDGYQATATILQDKRFARLPVIAMTAHAIKEERQRCFDAGMVDYITKPIEPRVMFETIVRWLPEHLKRQDKVNNRAATASVTPESATELPDLAGVDLADGLRRIGGNTALYRRLLQGFAQRYGHQADDIEQAIAQGERDSAGKIVHALKGVSANLGAYDLTNQAVALEQALKNGAEPAELRPVLTALKSTLETLVAAIQHGLQTSAELSATPDSRQNSPVDQQHHSALFSELLRLVEQADGDTLEFVTEHQATLKTWFTEDAWQKFHNDLIAYDFISAQSQLQQIGNHDIKPGIAR